MTAFKKGGVTAMLAVALVVCCLLLLVLVSRYCRMGPVLITVVDTSRRGGEAGT
jgi:hypothetical protein